jgi:hypothetical protein
MLYKLLSINRQDLLYLPVVKVNDSEQPYCTNVGYGFAPGSIVYVVTVDSGSTIEFVETSGGASVEGVLAGKTGTNGKWIRLDQGIDSTEISPEIPIDGTLVETQYQVQLDARFGSIMSAKSNVAAPVPSYVDDDYIANYFFTVADTNYVEVNTNIESGSNEVISGPRGTKLMLRVKASLDLATNDYLFTTLGTTDSWTGKSGVASNVYVIDTFIRVIGVTTGYSIDIPIKFVRIQ